MDVTALAAADCAVFGEVTPPGEVWLDPLALETAELASAASDPSAGVRLSGPVSEEAVARLHGMGFRRFAVDAAEIRPARLALAKAALAT
jgi:pyruvate,orthophosphate dikinase